MRQISWEVNSDLSILPDKANIKKTTTKVATDLIYSFYISPSLNCILVFPFFIVFDLDGNSWKVQVENSEVINFV